MSQSTQHTEHYDIVLIGAGVMSATLGALLHELEPEAKIGIFERLGEIAKESSDIFSIYFG